MEQIWTYASGPPAAAIATSFPCLEWHFDGFYWRLSEGWWQISDINSGVNFFQIHALHCAQMSPFKVVQGGSSEQTVDGPRLISMRDKGPPTAVTSYNEELSWSEMAGGGIPKRWLGLVAASTANSSRHFGSNTLQAQPQVLGAIISPSR
jgi:hypothetical protein